MKKLFHNIIGWGIKHKEEIQTAYLTLITASLLILILFAWAMVAMSRDLVEVVESKNNEIQEYKESIKQLTFERNEAKGLLDSFVQDYEDVIPKQQYLDDIEFLESVIFELRGEAERECNSNN